ncbi:MAG: tRNA lysidine(34) synthetase TilS [Alphaproteobacteria bacterium]|nr:tRNA lysidine(34) synthetase TilS [Alphaproteobacteria bacterium]
MPRKLYDSAVYQRFKQHLDALFSPIMTQHHWHFACACSGGADSMLLTLFMREWLKDYPDFPHQLYALMIDHQWRAESLPEAQQTQQYLQQCLIDAHILTAPNHTGRNNEAEARRERYQLLQQYCQQHDILFLLTGHQSDDKIEGFWLNLMRGSGLYGLTGLNMLRVVDDVQLIRPLLGADAAQIRHLLDESGIPYINDPANDSPKFTRNRIRKANNMFDQMGFNKQRILQTMQHLQGAKQVMHTQLTMLKAKHCLYHPLGFIRIDGALFANWHDDGYQSLLSKILADAIARLGKAYPPRYQKLLAVKQILQTQPTSLRGRHIAGVNLYWHNNALCLFPVKMPDDKNFDKSNRPQYWQLRPLGNDGIKQWRATKASAETSWLAIKTYLPRALIVQLPAWFDGEILQAVPFFGCINPSISHKTTKS